MTISHNETFNKTCNNIFSKQRNQRKTHLGVDMTIWSMGPRVLKKSIIIMPIKCWIIFLTMKSKKRRSLGGRSHFDVKKMGFTKNGCMMKMLKTQISKEILIEMDEGKLRSLEKCFLWREMVRWRRWIVSMEEEKLMEDKAKKEKEKRQRSGGPKFRPHT